MNDDKLDLLDLNDDNDEMDALPEVTQFSAPRPKKPWLLLGVGVLVIILATYIIIRVIGDDSSSSMEVDLDAPAIIVEDESVPPVNTNVEPMPVKTVPSPAVEPQKVQPVQAAQPLQVPAKPVVKQEPAAKPTAAPARTGTPVRVVEDRKDVSFNPDKQPVAKNANAKPAIKNQAQVKTSNVQASKGSWYVQFGSYSTRALAESAQKKLQASHQNLFAGKQFVILAAVLPNGTTTYRLRIAFANSGEANGFCRNAKSDGLDCYVAK